MAINCCKGCVAPKRYPGCQDHCTDYIIDNAFHQEEKAAKRKRNEISCGLTIQRTAAVTRAIKGRRN